ncbi:MAG: hypothetical protein N2234_01680 [Planctomycetota bacterium]|nr:hypothetical protein [Planctomycetota bacterium]
MNRTNLVLVILLAGCVGYIVGQSLSPVTYAATAEGGTPLVAVTGNYQNQDHDILYVIDGNAKTMAVYDVSNYQCKLIAARNIKFDLQLEEYGFQGKNPHSPRVKEVIEALEKLKERGK